MFLVLFALSVNNYLIHFYESGSNRTMHIFKFTVIANIRKRKYVAERGFDPRTSGLWAQHASTAPRCCGGRKGKLPNVDEKKEKKKKKPGLFLEGKKKAAPNKGLEPLTLRLKVWCSTDWANRALDTKRRRCASDQETNGAKYENGAASRIRTCEGNSHWISSPTP